MVSDLRLRRLGHVRVFSRVVIRRRSASCLVAVGYADVYLFIPPVLSPPLPPGSRARTLRAYDYAVLTRVSVDVFYDGNVSSYRDVYHVLFVSYRLGVLRMKIAR